VYRAATDRMTLSLSGALAVGALFLQSGALGLVAAGGYVVSLTMDLVRSDRLRLAREELRRCPPPLPLAEGFSDQMVREFLARVAKARDERESALASLANSARASTDTLIQDAFDSEADLAGLLDALERVNRYLGADARGPIAAELTRIQQAAAAAPSPAVRVEYDRSVAALSASLRSLGEVESCRALLQAKLEAIVGTLEAVPLRLMALDLGQRTAAAIEQVSAPEPIMQELATLEEVATADSAPMRPVVLATGEAIVLSGLSTQAHP
jgi:hypothetical protein